MGHRALERPDDAQTSGGPTGEIRGAVQLEDDALDLRTATRGSRAAAGADLGRDAPQEDRDDSPVLRPLGPGARSGSGQTDTRRARGAYRVKGRRPRSGASRREHAIS